MTDESTPPAPGWWMAADGRWYPPDPGGEAADAEPVPLPSAARETMAGDPGTELPPGVPPPPGFDAPAAEPPAPSGAEDGDQSRDPKLLVAGAAVILLVVGVLVAQTTGGEDPPSSEEQLEDALARQVEDFDLTPFESDVEESIDEIQRESTRDEGFTLVDRDYEWNTEEIIGVPMTSLDDAVLEGVSYRLEIHEVGRADEFAHDGEVRRAREGQEFLFVSYRLDRLRTVHFPSVALEIDGVKQSVGVGVDERKTLIKAIDADATELAFNVVDDDTNQTISLADGERASTGPQILYRDRRRIAVNDFAALSYVYTDPRERPSCGSGGEGLLELTIGDAELAWTGEDSEVLLDVQAADRLRPAGDPERAWLVLAVNHYRATGPETCSYWPVIPAASIVVVDAAGDESTSVEDLGAQTDALVFEVDAAVEDLTLELRPGAGILDQSKAGHTYDFGGATGQIPISFP